MIPPDQMFAVFEEGELQSMYLGSTVSSAKKFAEHSAVFQKLESYVVRDKSWTGFIVERIGEIAKRKVDRKYANPWDNCLIAYLHLLELHDMEKAKEGAKAALGFVNGSYFVRSMIGSILGLEYLEMDVVIDIQSVHPEFALPVAMSDGAAGCDLRYLDPEGSADNPVEVTLKPGERRLLPLGCKMAIPKGWMVKVVPRSGLALKRGLTLINSPGIIDSDYRGEMGAIVINESDEEVTLDHGERVCQILVSRVPDVGFKMVDKLSSTARGEGGFGSTGR